MRTLGTRLGLIQRSKGQSAIATSIYGHSGLTFSGSKIVKSTEIKEIVRHKIYLPLGADTRFRDPHLLWAAAERAELRKDAVLARRLDLTLPRQLSFEAAAHIVDQVAGRFAAFGVPAQADTHITRAKDSGLNPHVHFLVGERRLIGDAFENVKCIAVIKTFRTGFGRPLRNRLAQIINEVAQEYGHSAPLVSATPFSNDGKREPRLPRHQMRAAKNNLPPELKKFRASRLPQSFPEVGKMDDLSIEFASETPPKIGSVNIKNEVVAMLFAPPEEMDSLRISPTEADVDLVSFSTLSDPGDPYAAEEIYEDDELLDEASDEPRFYDANDPDLNDEDDYDSDPDPADNDYESEPDY